MVAGARQSSARARLSETRFISWRSFYVYHPLTKTTRLSEQRQATGGNRNRASVRRDMSSCRFGQPPKCGSAHSSCGRRRVVERQLAVVIASN